VEVETSSSLAAVSEQLFFDGRLLDRRVEVCLAILGEGATISGSGEIVTLKLRTLSPNAGSLTFGTADIRDAENRRLTVQTKEIEIPFLPTSFGLNQNHPNPFNPMTVISYQIPHPGVVTIRIYNVAGQMVRMLVDETKAAGYHSVIWNGRNDAGNDVSSGIYFYQMISGDYSASRKMILVK